MVLRKYLDGAKIESISQVENDRVLHFTFSNRNELGDIENIVLIVEIMGRHSAIILMNKESRKILDCIKHVGTSQNTYRTLLPGADYIDPPKQTQRDPFKVDDEWVFQNLSKAENLDGGYLQQHFQGLGSDTAQEIAYRLKKNSNEKMATWQKFWQEITEKPVPTLSRSHEKEFFTPVFYQFLGTDAAVYDSYSQLLDAFYEGKAEKDRVKQQSGQLLKKIQTDLKRNRSKLKKLQRSLKDTENAEEFRKKGELLTTFMAQVPRGAAEVSLSDYYNEDKPLTIKTDPAYSPAQNAQKYFQKYQKLKKSVHIVQDQIDQTQQEVQYLESVISQLEIATPKDVELIREELLQEGYIKKRRHGDKKNQKPSQPEKFVASDGTLILVGKNNLQNDKLTLKTARKTDIWLHAQKIPGSHVIIQNDQPSQETLIEAAILAAYFSKYRLSASVPIDYTKVRNVHKPNGSKPGYVIYEHQKTLFVTPTKEQVEKLQK